MGWGNEFMKQYLAKLASDYENTLELLVTKDGEAGQNKITGRLIPGASVAWCFNDDVDFWKSGGENYRHPHDWPYRGFIVPFPESNGRGEMEPEHVCLVIVDYPIEKENPVTDWGTLAQLLANPDLHRFYVFEPIVLAK